MFDRRNKQVQQNKPTFDDDTVFWGLILGFFSGMVAWFFRVPKRGEDTRHDIVNVGKNVVGTDPAHSSLEQGRRIARQRQQSLDQS